MPQRKVDNVENNDDNEDPNDYNVYRPRGIRGGFYPRGFGRGQRGGGQ